MFLFCFTSGPRKTMRVTTLEREREQKPQLDLKNNKQFLLACHKANFVCSEVEIKKVCHKTRLV